MSRGAAVTWTIPITANPATALLDTNAKKVILFNQPQRSVAIVDTTSGRVEVSSQLPAGALAAAVDHRRGLLVVASCVQAGAMADQARGRAVRPVVQILNSSTGKVLQDVVLTDEPEGADVGCPNAAAIDAATGQAVVSAWGGSVYVVDVVGGHLLTSLRVPPSSQTEIGISEHSHRAYVASTFTSEHEAVSVIDTRNGRLLRSLPIGHVTAIGLDKRSDLVVLGERFGLVHVVTPSTDTVLHTVRLGGTDLMAIDSDRGRAYLIERIPSKSLTVMDIRSGRALVGPVAIGGSPEAIEVDPLSGRVFLADSLSNTVKILDGGSAELLESVRLGEPVEVTIRGETTPARFGMRVLIDEGARRVFVVGARVLAMLDIREGTL